MKYNYFIFINLLLIAFLTFSGGAKATDTRDIFNLFMSPDWCGKSLIECTGGPAQRMRDQIAVQLKEGLTREQIVAYWVEKYSVKILSAPPKQGFFWMAWVTPFAVLVAGGLLLLAFLNNSKQRKTAAGNVPEHESDDLLEKRLDMEIRKRI
jgi:cytochrome c-type biogenesis protein CcmH